MVMLGVGLGQKPGLVPALGSGLTEAPSPPRCLPGFWSLTPASSSSSLSSSSSWGLPLTRRVPEGKRAETQPRAVMRPAVQGPGCCPHPLPSRGAALRPPLGQTPAGTSAGPVVAQGTICPLSRHCLSQLPSQADTAGGGLEDFPASPCSPSPRLAPDPTTTLSSPGPGAARGAGPTHRGPQPTCGLPLSPVMPAGPAPLRATPSRGPQRPH